jgi:CrcB protein
MITDLANQWRYAVLQTSLLIALGGALGTLGRFWFAEAFSLWFGNGFPWGTLFVNISGCFMIGLFATATGPDSRFAVSHLMRQFVMIGICGGYTTFSAFSLQTLDMIQRGAWGIAALHIAMSVVTCLIAVWLGALAAGMLDVLKGA